MTFSMYFYSESEADALVDLAITAAVRGPYRTAHCYAHTYHRLLTDASGIFTLRLKNIVRGSRYRVEVATTGALAGEGTVPAGAGDMVDLDLMLPYYSAGHANNDLRIKVRKGTTVPKYQPFEVPTLAQEGIVISYISQTTDPIA